MRAQGLIETGPGTVRLTRRGRLLQNAVMQQLMDFA
jgi:coproporphyrinogen III oxidase-like Fe-S oxidoreductase